MCALNATDLGVPIVGLLPGPTFTLQHLSECSFQTVISDDFKNIPTAIQLNQMIHIYMYAFPKDGLIGVGSL